MIANDEPDQDYAGDEAVCSTCGSSELASIEESVDWQWVKYVLTPDGFEIDDESWGDRVGDSYSKTVGIACVTCQTETYWEVEGPPAPQRAIARREDYEVSHPVVDWSVTRTLRGQGEPETVVVQARNEHEAKIAGGSYPYVATAVERTEEESDVG